MKKILVFSFFILIFSFCPVKIQKQNFCFANQNFEFKIENKNFEIDYKNQEFINLTKLRKEVTKKSVEEKIKIAKKIYSMGFDKKTILNYIYPNIDVQIDKIAENVYIKPVNAGIKSLKNCKIEYFYEKNGVKIDKNKIYSAIFDNLVNGEICNLEFEQIIPTVKYEDIKGKYFVCGEFKTYFNTENEERTQNIKKAVSSINGVLLKSGEVFSFNDCTGVRNEENGYKQAKIISNGKYTEGFGGGVCQVSSTLYNAALLSDLEIKEVHGHSIKSAYIKPGFDAMVNYGSADLKFKNNLSNDVLICACVNGNECRVCIYATEQKYKIKERFEIDESEDQENKIKTSSYLDYYVDDVLMKTTKIRENNYLIASV